MNLIALDLDGTLEDSRADMVAATNRARASLGASPKDPDALRPHMSRGMPHLYRTCFDDVLGPLGDESPRLHEVKRAFADAYLSHVADETRLYDGMADTLAALAQAHRLACVTNKPEQISRALLDALGVAPLFSTVVGGDSCAAPKPDPVMLQTACDQVGLAPPARSKPAVWMVGDSAGDVRLAQAFGATSVWCRWGYHDDIAPLRPDHVADRPQDLLRVITPVAA